MEFIKEFIKFFKSQKKILVITYFNYFINFWWFDCFISRFCGGSIYLRNILKIYV